MQGKGGNLIMKYKSKRIINILLIVCILVSNFIGSVFAAKHIFSDSIGHWAEETLIFLLKGELFKAILMDYLTQIILLQGESFQHSWQEPWSLKPKTVGVLNQHLKIL